MATPAGAADAVTPGVRLRSVLEEVRAVAAWLWQRGWAERSAGNVSLDVTDLASGPVPGGALAVAERIPSACLAGRWFLVSAGGARFRDMARRPERGLLLIRIADGADGYHVVWPRGDSGRRPTSELGTHLAVHARRREMGSGHLAVLHTHPTHLIALNQLPAGADEVWLNRAVLAMMPEVLLFVGDGIGVVPYHRPGSPGLARATADAVRRHRVLVWDRHGCLSVERDLTEAFDLIDIVDKAARLHLLCLAAGQAPRGLGAAEMGELSDRAGHRHP